MGADAAGPRCRLPAPHLGLLPPWQRPGSGLSGRGCPSLGPPGGAAEGAVTACKLAESAAHPPVERCDCATLRGAEERNGLYGSPRSTTTK
ncbi:hypothetical protein NDU88_005598 [Pleurodeles waltl]|uniref:Uncharacterized protein n=1 Tax=Pleurodeles waltl TaxID=8319 RepID=A0AAV7M9T4_PLEWA|nr:hypothetical protein NDU88_005598 [Pleurodeles waltl]